MQGIVDSIEYAEYGTEEKPDIKVAKMEWGTFEKLIEQSKRETCSCMRIFSLA